MIAETIMLAIRVAGPKKRKTTFITFFIIKVCLNEASIISMALHNRAYCFCIDEKLVIKLMLT